MHSSCDVIVIQKTQLLLFHLVFVEEHCSKMDFVQWIRAGGNIYISTDMEHSVTPINHKNLNECVN